MSPPSGTFLGFVPQDHGRWLWQLWDQTQPNLATHNGLLKSILYFQSSHSPSHFHSIKVDHHICFMACGAPSAPESLEDIFLLPVISHLLLFLYWSLNLLKSLRMFLLCGHLRSYWTNKCPHSKTKFKTADTSQLPEVRGREIETGWLEKSWTWIKGTTSLHFLFLHILAQEHVILVTPAKTLIKKATVRERQKPYDFTLLWI